MYSISFPKMFSKSKTLLYQDHEAIKSNLIILLGSDKLALLGDPYYGTQLKKVLFEQNAPIVKDLIIDEIYSSIITFMPQVLLDRNDVQITCDGVDVYAEIKCRYYLDNVSDLYVINMTKNDSTE